MERPLVSVIVPVYNVAPYLRRAVESVRRQTYENLEILLVDDGSTDGSGALCDVLGKEDGRVAPLHKENGGVSSARNAGVEAVRGAYLFFLDADDEIAPETIAFLQEALEAQNCDLAVCGFLYSYVDAQGRVYEEIPKVLEREGLYTPMEFWRLFRSDVEDELANVEACTNKLYRARFFSDEKARFAQDVSYGEDGDFMVDFLARCRRIYYLRQPLYRYVRYDRTMRESGSNRLYCDRFAHYKRLYRKLCRNIAPLATPEDLARCRHNFADKTILACILLCRDDAPYAWEEARQKLQAIVDDPAVIEAMPFYRRKPRSSWTVPLLIRLRQVEYLAYFARKIARRRYGGKETKGL